MGGFCRFRNLSHSRLMSRIFSMNIPEKKLFSALVAVQAVRAGGRGAALRRGRLQQQIHSAVTVHRLEENVQASKAR